MNCTNRYQVYLSSFGTHRFRKKNTHGLCCVCYALYELSWWRTDYHFWSVHTDSLLLIHHMSTLEVNNSSLNTVAWRTASMRPVFTNHGPVSFKVYLATNPCYKLTGSFSVTYPLILVLQPTLKIVQVYVGKKWLYNKNVFDFYQ